MEFIKNGFCGWFELKINFFILDQILRLGSILVSTLVLASFVFFQSLEPMSIVHDNQLEN